MIPFSLRHTQGYGLKIRCPPPPLPLICQNKSLLAAMLVTLYHSVNEIIRIFGTCILRN